MKLVRSNVSKTVVGACAMLSALLGGCVAPGPTAPPAPLVSAARPMPPARPSAPIDWHDMPATPGVWQWVREGRLSVARFGEPTLFSLTCNPLAGTVGLTRSGVPGAATTMTVVTTSASRVLPVQSRGDGAVATLSSRDPLLDAMAYSRGRFAVQVPGSAPLYLPSWPEVSRVIEDCRARPTVQPDR